MDLECKKKEQCPKISIKVMNAVMRLCFWNNENIKRIIFLYVFISFLLLIDGYLIYSANLINASPYLISIPVILAAILLGSLKSFPISVLAALFNLYLVHIMQKGSLQVLSSVRSFLFFILCSTIIGSLFSYIKYILRNGNKNSYVDIFTGYPNFYQWIYDFRQLCEDNPGCVCTYVLFELENIDYVGECANYESKQSRLKKIIDFTREYFDMGRVYVISSHRFMLMLKKTKLSDAYNNVERFADIIKKQSFLHKERIALVIKAGMDSIPAKRNYQDKVLNNLEKALNQSYLIGKEIAVYDAQIDIGRRNFYNTLTSIYSAYENDGFYLLYQPQVDIKKKEVKGVEALLRWDSEKYGNIPISEVVKIAEEADFIHKITKWVILSSMEQLNKWQKENKHFKIAVNISARDLRDSSLYYFIKDGIEYYQIDPTLLEFELTERSIIENEVKVFELLNKIKKLGIRISLDDYGTGYNSLIYLVKTLFCFDFVKIDKVFIDEIENDNTQHLIRGIINASHGLGIKVIAEGVETEKQLYILERLKCDIIQGYYYSRPIPAKEMDVFLQSDKMIL